MDCPHALIPLFDKAHSVKIDTIENILLINGHGMKAILSKPLLQTTLRYIAAYTIFLILAGLALVILMRLRINLIQIGVYFDLWHRVIYALQMWGMYILFIPYLAAVVWMESYLNEAAKKNLIWQRTLKILLIEAIVGAFTLILSTLLVFLK